MGCSTCSTGGGLPKGCKGNGNCPDTGCNTLTVFDWLSDMDLPDGKKTFEWVEVRFKNGRKEFYKNETDKTLHIGDTVTVQAASGHDIGMVALSGELVRLQMRKKKFRQIPEQTLAIYRKSNQKEIDVWQKNRELESETMIKAREIAARLGLEMKISDVEYQGDGSKATFYYTAEERVDFRQLIRELAGLFRVKIEMRQIGARQEASRLGGIGSCGRELCCSTWLTDFRSVSTAAARYQQLSLNPTKLAGQCGKLKCCLNYELDSYMDALKGFPSTSKKLKTTKGDALYMKMDIFKGLMWYAYVEDSMTWVPMSVDAVHEVLKMNAKGDVPASLEEFMIEPVAAEIKFENVMGKDDINRFDRQQSSGKRRRKKPTAKKNADQKTSNQNTTAATPKANNPGEGQNRRRNKRRRPSGRNNNKSTPNA